MKPLMLPLLFLVTAIAVAADETKDPYHTFRDDQGRTIRATVVRTGVDEVWIRRDDGRTFRVALSTFSEEDQTFIAEWKRKNALKAPKAIDFAARRFSDGRETGKTSSRKTRVENYGYIVTVTNRTAIDLEGLEIEYRTFALRGDVGETGQNRKLETHFGTARIEKLSAQKKEEFKTETIPLSFVALRPGWVFGNRNGSTSNQRRITDDLGGIWVRVKQNGELIAEYCTPSKLKETQSW